MKYHFRDVAPDRPPGNMRLTRRLNWYTQDTNLQARLASVAPDIAQRYAGTFQRMGAWAATALEAQATYTDEEAPPELIASYDARGNQTGGYAKTNPWYEQAHQDAYAFDLLREPYELRHGSHLPAFIGQYLISQADISVGCPYCMTAGVIYGLHRYDLDAATRQLIADVYLPELERRDGHTSTGGTWVTEEPSGSDPGQTATQAVLDERDDDDVQTARLYGKKWFASNATGQVALAMARPEGAAEGVKGLALYLVPSHKPDGEENDYMLDHQAATPGDNPDRRGLKAKMGTKGLPTGEIRLDGAYAIELAPEGKGMRMMMEVLSNSRIHNAMAAAGVARRAFMEGLTYADNRQTWGELISEKPLMMRDLADLAVESESAFALAFNAARAFDDADRDDGQKPWMRLMTALAKNRTAQQAIDSAGLAKKIYGGNGYTRDAGVERVLRDTHVLDVWEGPDNIQALELMRLATQHPDVIQHYFQRIDDMMRDAPAMLQPLMPLVANLVQDIGARLQEMNNTPAAAEDYAKDVMDDMATAMQAALLVEEAGHALETHNDARKAIIARRFCEVKLGDKRHPYRPSYPDPAVTHARAVLDGQALRPEDVQQPKAQQGRAPSGP